MAREWHGKADAYGRITPLCDQNLPAQQPWTSGMLLGEGLIHLSNALIADPHHR
jgi:hypothetical protein